MRYRGDEELSYGTKRNLEKLREALTQLLTKKSLEKISVQELCDLAQISRGTFYNYFYDKYDLLNYDWKNIQKEIDPEFTHNHLNFDDYEDYINLFFENLLAHLEEEKESYRMIIKNNEESIFSASMQDYLEKQILIKLRMAIDSGKESMIPLDLLAPIYASTIMTVGKWWLIAEDVYKKEEVYNYFRLLIENKLIFK